MRKVVLLGLAMALLGPLPARADRVDQLVSDLTLGDPPAKVAAVKGLADIGGARVEEPLIKALTDTDKVVRLRAAEALGRLKSRKAVEGLSNRLRFDGEPTVRRQAVRSLETIGESPAVEALIRALDDTDPFVVRLAARALGGLGDHSATGPLMESYESDPHPFVAAEIAIALGRLPESRYKDFYLTRLTDSSAAVRRAAVQALSALGSRDSYEHLRYLAERDDDPSVRRAAEDAAKRLAP